MSLSIDICTGDRLLSMLGALARLRIQVFREFPYLYQGNERYERDYLAGFAATSGALAIIVRDGRRVIGAATASPLEGQSDLLVGPVRRAGFDPADTFLLGESMLLTAYRGQGLGRLFFDRREEAAWQMGARWTAFTAVKRCPLDPRRPAQYRPLEDFWGRRGYTPVEGMTLEFTWPEIGETAPSPKLMQYWVREAA